MSLSIDVLPKEVLGLVFSYLSVTDKLSVCLVCKKWLSIMNCKLLLRNIRVFVFDNNQVPILANMSRNFLNFSFKLIIVDKKYYDLFRHFSSVVECITFEKCEIWKREPVVFDDLTYDNLKVLKIIDCDLWSLFPSLPNLSELYLSGNSTITDDGLAILQKSMKHLNVLTLYCNGTFDAKAYKRFYSHGSSYESTPSPYILSLPAIKSFISERVNTLKELNLFCRSLTPQALKEISLIENLRLEKISLKNCHDCTGSLIDLFKNQPTLKTLDLNGIMGLNSDTLSALCTLIPDIEDIRINSCTLTEESFSKVFQLKKLKSLDIGRNYASESGFSRAVSNFASIHLQALDVSGILIRNIDILIKKCKYLVHLNLSHCEVTDKLLYFISGNLIHLETLSLKRTDITDYGLTGICQAEGVENNIELIDEDKHKSISNLKYLKKLKLNYCSKITNIGIVKAVHFKSLEYLNLAGCNILHSTLETLLIQNPSMKKIYCDDPINDSRVVNKKSKYYSVDDDYTVTLFDKW